MQIITRIQDILKQAIQEEYGPLTAEKPFTLQLQLDPEKHHFGDISTNAAMIIAKEQKCAPHIIGNTLIKKLIHPLIKKAELAGAGFINISLSEEAYTLLAQAIYTQDKAFFIPEKLSSQSYLVEYVSANPTGPLHLGHGRGGIIGDVLSNVLSFIGHQVIREYYINDAGSQITKLGNSFKIRCLQQLGQSLTMPEDGYHGEYLITLATECVAKKGNALLEESDQFFAIYAKDALLEDIKHTLKLYGITFDVWFSEKTLHESGAIMDALQRLKNAHTTYNQDGALWFKSTAYGDDKDRVLQKANGELTYIAADVAYLENKFKRAANLIFVLGQDHHSYACRLKGIAQALGHNPDKVDIILYQLVTLKNEGALVRMSKRAGTMISLFDIINAVGVDVARFFFLHRKADAHLDFDISLALKKTDENPVYYIQYAYVRTQSILAKTKDHQLLNTFSEKDLTNLQIDEQLLIKKITSLQTILLDISTHYQTHVLTYYTVELAQLFHAYYARHTIIDIEQPAISRMRLALTKMVAQTFNTTFDLLGISKPLSM